MTITPQAQVSEESINFLRIMAAEIRVKIADFKNPAIHSYATEEHLISLDKRANALEIAVRALSAPPAQVSEERPQHWAVSVRADGDEIVCIESNCLSGRDISEQDEKTIRNAAHHLLAFIGDPDSSALREELK